MPSMNASRITLGKVYAPVQRPVAPIRPVSTGGGTPQPVRAPAPPYHLQQSTIMISSLPSISTDVDGIIRQFYGGRPLPMRRLILPS